MPTTPNSSEPWREALKLINRCPVCRSAYEAERAKVFAATAASGLVHLTCAKCRGYFVALVAVMGSGISSVGIVTDLNFDDAARLYQADALSVDDVVTGYEMIHHGTMMQSLLLIGTAV